MATVAAVAVWAIYQPSAETPQPETVTAPAESAALPATTPVGGALTVQTIDEGVEFPARGFSFKQNGATLEADGVKLTAPGEVEFTSRLSGGKVTQRLLSAALVSGGNVVRTLPKTAKAEARTDRTRRSSSVRYDGFFEGVDLEYRYDGKQIEEFFHISDALKKELAANDADLEILTIFPGLNREEAFVNPDVVGGHPMRDADGKLVAAIEAETGITKGTVELGVYGGHSFVLPGAYAMDAGGSRAELERTFTWRSDGLEVAVALAASWVEKSEGKIFIDPSLADWNVSLDLSHNSYSPTQKVVKDSIGQIHLVYKRYWPADPGGLYPAGWYATHITGDGTVWGAPRLIDYYRYGDDRVYGVGVVIDRNDTLHAFWGDYGNHPDRQTTGNRHKVHYARCANRCAGGNDWELNGERGGSILAFGSDHNLRFTAAVDQDDTVHLIMNYTTNRYVQIDPLGTITLHTAPALQTGDRLNLVVDESNRLHLLRSEPGNELMTHFTWDGNLTWVEEPGFQIIGDGDADFTLRHSHREVSASVDSLNRIHTCVDLYDGSRWRVGYSRWNPAAQNWESTGVISPPNPTSSYHQYGCSVTVDVDNAAYVFWHRYQAPYVISYLELPNGGAWSTLQYLLPGDASEAVWPTVLQRRSFPLGPNRTVASGQPELFFRYRGTQLRYGLLGALVEAPIPVGPPDGGFLADTTPTLSWNRISRDDGTNTTYELQFDTTPSFENNPLPVSTGAAISYELSGTPPELFVNGGYYYWRARATLGGVTGPWGAIWEIAIDTDQPNPFTLIAPSDGAQIPTVTPTFEWQAATDPN